MVPFATNLNKKIDDQRKTYPTSPSIRTRKQKTQSYEANATTILAPPPQKKPKTTKPKKKHTTTDKKKSTHPVNGKINES